MKNLIITVILALPFCLFAQSVGISADGLA